MCNSFYVFDKTCNHLRKGLKNTQIQAFGKQLSHVVCPGPLLAHLG